ncbi:BRCA1-associated protein [Vigna unguiculata]|uniref:BRCA1-associated protein n=1 Tax=Vigna unguiculata TaxID=3917 RepID=A0A4D6LMZ6_VIGUN|nr:BRCA1-associated protein [Vigna unguiculata]
MSPLIRVALAINFISSSRSFIMLTNLLPLLRTLLKWTSRSFFHPLTCTLSGDNSITCHHVSTSFVSLEEEDCAVCLCKMGETEEEIVTLRCEHAFHTACFDTWVGFNCNTTTCPLCRDSVVTTSH